ncbi:hypothetical protein ACRALDRAFT_2018535 [Sodiomyces alcalophilus JCM 7366]
MAGYRCCVDNPYSWPQIRHQLNLPRCMMESLLVGQNIQWPIRCYTSWRFRFPKQENDHKDLTFTPTFQKWVWSYVVLVHKGQTDRAEEAPVAKNTQLGHPSPNYFVLNFYRCKSARLGTNPKPDSYASNRLIPAAAKRIYERLSTNPLPVAETDGHLQPPAPDVSCWEFPFPPLQSAVRLSSSRRFPGFERTSPYDEALIYFNVAVNYQYHQLRWVVGHHQVYPLKLVFTNYHTIIFSLPWKHPNLVNVSG